MALRNHVVPPSPATERTARHSLWQRLSQHRARHRGELAGPAAQDWLPLQAVQEGCLIRPDGAVVAGLQIAPYSLALKSAREQSQAVAGLWAALNGLTVPWQWLSMDRPVDLDHYLTSLEAQLATAEGIRRKILRDYRHWVYHLARSGETVERQYYLLCTRTGPEAISAHHTALRALQENLGRIRGMQVTILDDAAWRELLFLTFHAPHAAGETVPDGLARSAPLYHVPSAEEGTP